jgi:Fe-S cluster assembly protein SufD
MEPTVSHPRVLVHADRLSSATVIESYVSLSEEQYFTNAVAELIVGEGARLDHYRLMTESPKAFHIGTTRVRLDRDSVFDSLSFAHGSQIGRNDLHVLLDAPGGECNLLGLYMTNGRSHLDNHISVTHARPHATSRQLYKGILTDRSRAVFSGVVLVEPDAQKTYATQRDMNLLLSHGAEVDTKPSLLIYADDVQCFHGAAAGEMDENALFYMLSRGLDRETAQKMLVHSFTAEIIEEVKPEPLRSYLDEFVTSLMPKFRYEDSK